MFPAKAGWANWRRSCSSKPGLSFRRQERSLFARVGEMPIDITFLRTDDIPVLCAEGAIDMGITGSDLVAEAGADVLTRLDLGVGQVQAGPLRAGRFRTFTKPRNSPASASPPAFPTSRSSYLAEHKADVHLVNLGGSVEIMITLGVADAIVDLVETGSTLAANRLRVLAEIGRYETVLIQNKARREAELADRVVRRLRRRRHRPQLVAAGIQHSPHQAGRGRKNHPRLQQPHRQLPGRPRLVRRPRHGPPRRSDRHHGKARSARGHAILETQITNCRL